MNTQSAHVEEHTHTHANMNTLLSGEHAQKLFKSPDNDYITHHRRGNLRPEGPAGLAGERCFKAPPK